MKKQTIWGLAGAAIILSLLAYFLYQPVPEQFVTKPWLPDLAQKLNRLTTLELRQGEKQVHLQKNNGHWTVKEKFDYPASVDKIRTLIHALQDAQIKGIKTNDPKKHDRLELTAQKATRIRMLAGEEILLDVMLGKQGPNYQGRYVRASDNNQAYWIDKNPDISLDPVHWLEREIIGIEPAQIRRVTYQPNGDVKPLVVERSAPSEKHFTIRDLPKDRELAFEGAADVVDTVLLGVRLEDVRPRPEKDEQPVHTTTVDTFDGKQIIVRLFEPKENELWAEFDVQFVPENIQRREAKQKTASETQVSQTEKDAALQLSKRLKPWRYKLSSYQSQVLRKKIEDFTRAKTDKSQEKTDVASDTKGHNPHK